MIMIPEAIDVIMVNLIKQDFLNEVRFATSFARRKTSDKTLGNYSHKTLT